MRQVIQSFKSGEICIEEVPPPTVRPDGLIVSTRVSLVSAGTEKQIIDLARKSLVGKARSRPDLVKKVLDKARADGIFSAFETARTRLDQPFPLGYSCAGIVDEVGRGVAGVSAGDHVACGGQNYASHAERNFVPKNISVKMPDRLDMESASFVTVGAIALQAVRQADVRLGEVVCVIGLGLIGQIVVQLLKASGCIVIGTDPDPSKVSLAMELGCDEAVGGDPAGVVDAMTGGRGVDSVIIAASTSSNGPVEKAGEISRTKGRVVVVGAVGMNIPRKSYYERELEIRLSMSYGPGRYDPNYEEYGHDYPYGYVRWTENRNMEAFLHLLSEGKVDVKKLITHRFTIDDALKAYDLLEGRSREPFLGILLTYPEPKQALDRTITLSTRAKTGHHARKESVIGLVGAGGFAQGLLLPSLKRIADCRLRGLSDIRGEVAKETAKKMDFDFCCSDYQELLADPDINTVFITTRHNTHARMVCDALAAGKNTFVEKPLCLTEAELDEIIEVYTAQQEQGRCRLMVGFNRRFAPLIGRVKDAFENHRTPLVMSYRVNAGNIPRSSWVQSVEEGGGRIIGEVCHFVDLLGFVAGSRLKSVQASSVDLDLENLVKEDNLIVTLEYDDGSIGSVLYTSLGDKAFSKEYLEVFGDSHVATMDNFRKFSFSTGGRTIREKSMKQKKGHFEEAQAFIGSIIRGEPSPIPFEDLVSSTRATFRILASLKQKGPVSLQ